jgi:CHAD domain-containing protein
VSTRELISDREPDLGALEQLLEAEFAVVVERPRESDCVYLDTFDALLRGRDLVLVHSDGSLVLKDRWSGAVLQSLRWPQPPAEPLLADALAPGAMRDALRKVVEARALLPLVHVHERTDELRMLDSLEKTVVRVGLIAPALVSSTGLRTPLRTRVRVSSVRGYDAELDRSHKLLSEGLALTAPELPLLDEALLAAGTPPDGASTRIDVHLRGEERSDVAAVRVLTALLAVIDANFEGTMADTDAEFLHDYRVAIRRTRAVQRELAGVFEPAPLAALRAEFRWLQQATGDARDLDVYLLGFETLRALLPQELRADLEPLREVLKGRRLTARREMTHALRSPRAVRLRADWEAMLSSLEHRPTADRPDAERPIGEVSSRRIRKVYRRMLEMGGAIDRSSPPTDYHELRKKGKELRYLLELFGVPLHDEAVVRPMIKSLKGLQDVLGRHQDREVQVTKLRALADEVSAIRGGSAALMAMGVLIQRLQEDAAAARGEFARSFAAFSGHDQRRLVKETFR